MSLREKGEMSVSKSSMNFCIHSCFASRWYGLTSKTTQQSRSCEIMKGTVKPVVTFQWNSEIWTRKTDGR